jgi:hypothetical protein
MPNALHLSLVVLLVILVVGWFAVGTQVNVRRGHKALEWLQQGLKLLGEKTTLRWLGSSVVELKMASARDPFRQAELLVVLEPRDVSFLWLAARLRGRRDLLILRAVLHHPPRFEFEAFDPGSWTARGLEAQLQHRNWNRVALAPPLVGYAAGDAPVNELHGAPATPASGAPGWQELLSLPGLVRLTLRRTEPQFELHCRLRDIQTQSAREYFEKVRAAVPAAVARPYR